MIFSNKIFTINKKNVLRIKQLLVKFSCSIPKIMKYAFLFGSNVFVVPGNTLSYVDNILSNTMLPDLSRQILGRIAEGASASRVQVSVAGGELTYAWDSELVEA